MLKLYPYNCSSQRSDSLFYTLEKLILQKLNWYKQHSSINISAATPIYIRIWSKIFQINASEKKTTGMSLNFLEVWGALIVQDYYYYTLFLLP